LIEVARRHPRVVQAAATTSRQRSAKEQRLVH